MVIKCSPITDKGIRISGHCHGSFEVASWQITLGHLKEPPKYIIILKPIEDLPLPQWIVQ